LIRIVANFLWIAGLWALLTEASVDSWVVGLPVVLAGTAASLRLAHGSMPPLRPLRILFFIGYFLRSSLLGGIDVTWRALHPDLPIRPQLVQYPLLLPRGAARTLFMAVVSLLPGTVSADIDGDLLITHVIDGRKPIQKELNRLERIVAWMFAVPLSPEGARQAGTTQVSTRA